MLLIPDELRRILLANGARSAVDGTGFDPSPVVKLFTPDAAAVWLLTELDASDHDVAFGLCDLGLGCPELGTVRLSDLARLRGPTGLGVERDVDFLAGTSLSAYLRDAQGKGWVDA